MEEALQTILPGITQTQIDQLRRYCELLREWNQRINLVSRQDASRLEENHILPSLGVLPLLEIGQGSWIMDIGSGGGLPAIPLKIVRPDLQLVMMDSIRKKSLFLRQAIERLALPQATVINDRVERAAEAVDLAGRFDLVTARAVAAIPQLLEWGRPFLRAGGRCLLWKGQSDLEELSAATADSGLELRIHRPPSEWQRLSSRFEELVWIEVTHSEST